MPVAPRIRAVTFDVGDTLIGCSPSVGHIYAEIAARHGCAVIEPDLLNRKFAKAWRELKDFGHTREQWSALVDATFAGLVRQLPSKTFFDALYQRFAEPNAWQVFEDVVPTLVALKTRGFQLGVISNWDGRLRPLLKGLGLESYFDAIVVSCEVGAPKPATTIFTCAAKQLGCAAGQILHVGDDSEKDAAGARAAGFEALLLKRDEGAAAPGTVRSLRELL